MSLPSSDLIILGRNLGTYTDWDDLDTNVQSFSGLRPAAGFSWPYSDLVFNSETGRLEHYDEDGNVDHSVDAIDALKHLPRSE